VASVSGIYGWQGGRNPPVKQPECSKAKHAELLKRSGRELFKARRDAYARYCRECRAWGREPMDEKGWFMYANAETVRLQRASGTGGAGGAGSAEKSPGPLQGEVVPHDPADIGGC